MIVTAVPVVADAGDTPEIEGFAATEKLTAFETCEATVTTTLPEVALAGTVQESELAAQFEQAAAIPLKVTVLEPCEAPKVVPLMTTVVPEVPLVGDRLVMWGVTVNEIPLLAFPPTVATTIPVVAAAGTGHVMVVAVQFVGLQLAPLKANVLAPCAAAKPVPVTVTPVPTGPEDTERLDK